MCEKDYVASKNMTCKRGTYLESIIDDSVVTSNEIIDAVQLEPIKTRPINFNNKKATCKINSFYVTCIFINYHIDIDCF